jgi:hypothetical protein
MSFKLTLILLLSISSIYAQNQTKKYTDCNGIKRYIVNKGDVITFECNNIMLINPRTLQWMDSSYVHLHKVSTSLVTKTDSASMIYRRLYDDKAQQYDILFNEFARFRSTTSNHVDSMRVNLFKIQENLINAKIDLKQANESIAAAVKNIEDANKKRWLERIKWGAIGFGAATLVFIATK